VVAFDVSQAENLWGQMDVPADLTNVVAVAASYQQGLALAGDGRPFLTSPLVDRTAAHGQTLHLRMTATGSWPLSYQWAFNDQVLPDETNSVLTLDNLKYEHAGKYSVVVTDGLGQTTGTEMSLAVVPLLIQDPPRNQSAFLGGRAEFRVAADGEGPLSYQWQFNGENLAEATNEMLLLKDAQFSQSGCGC
jgi:hypothetical protein